MPDSTLKQIPEFDSTAEQEVFFIDPEELLFQLASDPDTVDFVAPINQVTYTIFSQHSEIRLGITLEGRFGVYYAPRAVFESLTPLLGTNFINVVSMILGTLDRASLDASGITQVQRQPYLSLRGNGVIIGFVDTGIDYTLETFRYEDGTSKILYIYDETGFGPAPAGFPLGTEYTNEQINAALQSENPLSVVPEQDPSGHGTFLASVAAGREVNDFIGAAPDAEIIAVKLRKARPYYLEKNFVPPEQENAFESSSVMIGVEYILRKASALGRPVSICIGLGTNSGSHDGFSPLEEYLSYISRLPGVCLCTACGNESQARHHTQGKIPAAGATQNIDVRIPEKAGNILLSIWNSVSDRVSVSIRSPTGELVSRIPAKLGPSSITQLVLEPASVQVEYFFPFQRTGSQLSIVRIYNASPGIWTVTVHGDIILNGTFHAWLPMTGFVTPGVEFLSASPYYTITVPATMNGSICCGAYNYQLNLLYPTSSWGPTRMEAQAPDLAAPGQGVGGYFPQGYGVMDGTSTAAAITTGACALMLQWGIVQNNAPSISTYQIRGYLIRGCSRADEVIYPNFKWGYGTLNLIQSFNQMREL